MKSRFQSVMRRQLMKGTRFFNMSAHQTTPLGVSEMGMRVSSRGASNVALVGRSGLFFTGLGLCMFSVNEFQTQSQLTEKTTAVVVQRELIRRGGLGPVASENSNGSIFPQADVKYTVGGKTYRKRETFFEVPHWVPFVSSPTLLTPNRTVSIVYNPKNPMFSRIEGNKDFAIKTVMMGLYALFLAL